MPKETTVHIGKGMWINDQFVHVDPYVNVTKMGTLLMVETTIFVDQSNFSIDDKGICESAANLTFSELPEEEIPTPLNYNPPL